MTIKERKNTHTHTQAFHLHICFYDAIDQKAKQKKEVAFSTRSFPQERVSFFMSFEKIEN